MLDIVVVDPADGTSVMVASTRDAAAGHFHRQLPALCVLARFAMVLRDPATRCLWSSAATDVVVDTIGSLARRGRALTARPDAEAVRPARARTASLRRWNLVSRWAACRA